MKENADNRGQAMQSEITKRANQLMGCKEYGHELTWEKAIRFASEESEEKAWEAAKREAEKARKVALWNEYKADLRAAGASEAAIKVLAPANCEAFRDLPAFIAVGRIQFSTPEKEIAIKSAIRKLWLAIGYGEPDFCAETYTKQSYIKWGLK